MFGDYFVKCITSCSKSCKNVTVFGEIPMSARNFMWMQFLRGRQILLQAMQRIVMPDGYRPTLGMDTHL